MPLRATRLFTGDQVEVEAAFARCVFNVVLNNRDDHAKNFSFRMNARMEWKQSPAYDLTFDVGPRGQHQTSVMGEGSLPGRSHLLDLARHGGLPAARAVMVIDRTCEQAKHLETRLDSAGVRKATRKSIGGAVALNLARVATGG